MLRQPGVPGRVRLAREDGPLDRAVPGLDAVIEAFARGRARQRGMRWIRGDDVLDRDFGERGQSGARRRFESGVRQRDRGRAPGQARIEVAGDVEDPDRLGRRRAGVERRAQREYRFIGMPRVEQGLAESDRRRRLESHPAAARRERKPIAERTFDLSRLQRRSEHRQDRLGCGLGLAELGSDREEELDDLLVLAVLPPGGLDELESLIRISIRSEPRDTREDGIRTARTPSLRPRVELLLDTEQAEQRGDTRPEADRATERRPGHCREIVEPETPDQEGFDGEPDRQHDEARQQEMTTESADEVGSDDRRGEPRRTTPGDPARRVEEAMALGAQRDRDQRERREEKRSPAALEGRSDDQQHGEHEQQAGGIRLDERMRPVVARRRLAVEHAQSPGRIRESARLVGLGEQGVELRLRAGDDARGQLDLGAGLRFFRHRTQLAQPFGIEHASAVGVDREARIANQDLARLFDRALVALAPVARGIDRERRCEKANGQQQTHDRDRLQPAQFAELPCRHQAAKRCRSQRTDPERALAIKDEGPRAAEPAKYQRPLPHGNRARITPLVAAGIAACALGLAAGPGCKPADPGDAETDLGAGAGRARGSGAESDVGAEANAIAGASGPLLPEAPWFELPADWAEQHPTLSPNARPEVHWRQLAERQLRNDPADSAGRAWLESVTAIGLDPLARSGAEARPQIPASSRQRFTIGFEVGAPGIVEGGSIFVLPDPFWFWSGAQASQPAAPGYTTLRVGASPRPSAGAAVATASSEAALPVRFVPTELPGAFRVEGRALSGGERVEIVYGAGPAGAIVDRYAERGSELRIGLDANGDGQRAWLPDRLLVDVLPNEPAELLAFAPAELDPGEPFEIQLALVDAAGNRADWPEAVVAAGETRARFEVRSLPIATVEPASGIGERDSLAAEDTPHRLRLVAPAAEGTLRLEVRGLGALARFRTDLPPIVVRRSTTRLYWADLHGHTRFSDGTGTPDDYFRYARDVARLDAIALTDHDHWGLDPLDERPERQAEILALARAYHAPNRFVTLPGYEWTSWLHGHRHVLSFDDTLEIASSLDSETDSPDELWAFLRGKPVLTFAHHSAGEPVATNWHFAPDPELEPVTEIASVHGMSEAADAPSPVAGGFEGQFVRDVLRHGARLGFIGSGDSHDGHPGLAQIAAGQGGLAGLVARGLDRASLHAALKARRTFATNGIRAWLDVSLDGVPMGGLLAPGEGEHALRIRFEATAPIERIDLVRSGRVAALDPPDPGVLSLDLDRRIPRLRPGEFHYVRIVQVDGGVAWSSRSSSRRTATRTCPRSARRARAPAASGSDPLADAPPERKNE